MSRFRAHTRSPKLGAPLRACIVEPDLALARAIERELTSVGYDCNRESYPDACLATQEPWDLVVIAIPADASFAPLVLRLCAFFSLGNPSAVIIAMLPDRSRASLGFDVFHAGATAVIEKPFHPARLTALLAEERHEKGSPSSGTTSNAVIALISTGDDGDGRSR